MSHQYTEDNLVEQPAIGLFTELGWETVVATDDKVAENSLLGRTSKSETVLVLCLRAALEKLNSEVPMAAIDGAVDLLMRDRTAMGLAGANRETYALLKDGALISLPDTDKGGQKSVRVRIVDWDNPLANDFLLVSQMTIQGPLYTTRPDLIGFVNGLPLVVVELKKPGVAVRQGFDENLTSYMHPQNGAQCLFATNALLIVSNGTDSRVGSITADWERFFEWKRVESENEPRTVSLETMIRGTCEPSRLLDLVENFTLYSEAGTGLAKIVGQNHQFLGVNAAIEASLAARAEGHGRGGVFWQTQGSGKSYSMVFYAQKVLRKVPGDWTFVVVTDRTELDDQIAKTFKAVGAVNDAESKECHASSGAHLRELLRGNHRYVFTLIHKFQTPELLTDRRDVIVLVDEAHRSQYDTLAVNMRSALPNATFVAFTGTPLIADGAVTREIFGDYVSVYDFQQSVEDGATVPLYYENRTPELQLDNPQLDDQIYDLIEQADLDEDAQRRLDRELSRQAHLLKRDDRLETVATDIVRHFLDRGFRGKAMVVSIDKETALRMYVKVRRLWNEEADRTLQELARHGISEDREKELQERLEFIASTDMAVVVSPGQNEIEEMAKRGLDIVPHRKRMLEEALDEKFKDTCDPFRLVFVCAMWLTGFDAPSCSTIYLDKPMRNHTLMQTIARANRVYPGKHSGTIVDYANVFVSLEKALAIYGAGNHGERPVSDKSKLAEELRKAIDDATSFCFAYGVLLEAFEKLPTQSISRLNMLVEAVETLIAPDDRRKQFLAWERLVRALYNAVKPNPVVAEFVARVALMSTIAGMIREKLNPEPIDLSDVMAGIGKLLDESITGVAMVAKEGKRIDLSKIDFQALAKRFKDSKNKQTELEVLKAAIKAQLDRMVSINPTRTDFSDKFEALIAAYNSGAANIEDLFAELVKFTQDLSEEDQRHVRENLSDEELVIFDILTRPAPELSPEERTEVKKVARELLTRLKDLFVVDWRTRNHARARVKDEIDGLLDKRLPQSYPPDLYEAKCAEVFRHVYDAYSS